VIQPLELMIGLRYTRAKRRNHFISFISMTSMVGIILGVWALITVMSIMNGFHKDLRDRILFVVSHVTISDYNGYLDDWESVSKKIMDHPQVINQAPFVPMWTGREKFQRCLIILWMVTRMH
jgi:lipoprotein-releasing system permease protein